ncbi:site-specific DNA-methyltransferase [Roseomonas gilardii]|uniref:DNA-methyltransferase n=1 Tax=Roseomonas gilardii TaxID=257708 RepID=UPI0011A12E23|nr:site-specific DNA-methyltransferase [Roseomonas gilardii]
MARPKSKAPRASVASVRLTQGERTDMEVAAAALGLSSLSEYVRYLHEEASKVASPKIEKDGDKPSKYRFSTMRQHMQTKYGQALHGDALCYLHDGVEEKSVDLIMTSPPFGLVRQKDYGNEDAHRYCNWFRPFAEGFKRALKDNGSLVIDIGGAWKPGTPTRSLYHFELLVMLCEEYGFHLCQEHYWWNPSKLPSPAEWVNIRRVRVKDAVNTVWWLSPTPWPKASNRRVLAPYSPAMQVLLRDGYKPKLRPSGHNISDKFSHDNGGSVPPNLLAIANTESNGQYQDFCRQKGLPIHPARFPDTLPEYFIRFLTNPGDLVVDPFGGSCVTGAVAERLKRRWVCCELDESYLLGAEGRFTEAPRPAVKEITYSLAPPCRLPVDEEKVLLPADGGRKRPDPLSKDEHATVLQADPDVTRGEQPRLPIAAE